MKIHLPNSAFLGNIDQFIRDLDTSSPNHLKITANPKWVSVHPVVLSMIASLGIKICPSNIEYETMTAKSRNYFKRMRLFEILKINSGIDIQEHESSGRFIPLTQIKDSQQLENFISEVVPLLHLTPEKASPIKYVISELVRNVLEHSYCPDGAILSAQYYPKSNTIKLGVADTGIGIKASINKSHIADTNLDAIQLALTPGITGTTPKEGGTETNAGAGLFFIKSIAKSNKSFFILYSGDAMYKLLKDKRVEGKFKLYADPFIDRHSKKSGLPIWDGTVVGIDISLETTREFTSILDLIGRVYQESVKQRRITRHKQPKFI